MEQLMDFVKNLVVMSIVVTTLLNLVTGEKYTKYLRFITGLMFVAYAMSAITWIFDLKEGSLSMPSLEAEKEIEFGMGEELRDEMLEKGILESMAESIRYSLVTYGYTVTRVECAYIGDELSVSFYAPDSKNDAGIKKYINDFYQVEIQHIYGYTEAEDE